MKVLQPPGWAAPKGCASGVVARGETIVLAGRIGWHAACAFESDDLVEQVRQALPNVRALLAEAGAAREHIVRMTRFLTDKRRVPGAREIGRVCRETIGSYTLAMSAV